MDKNKVKINICGSEYCLSTDEDEEYILELGAQVDKKLTQILKENPYLSVTQGAIFLALQYADEERKANDTAQNLRSKIQKYLEESAKARTEAEVARREVERLRKSFQDND